MASYKTHDFVNLGKGKLGNKHHPNANDLTITFLAEVEVLGVNGIAPSNPNAPYTLEGDGSRVITITDIAQVGPGGSVKVRVKNEGKEAAKINKGKTHWTWNRKEITAEGSMLIAMMDSIEGEDTETG